MSKATGTAVNWVQMVGMKVMYLYTPYNIVMHLMLIFLTISMVVLITAWSGFHWNHCHLAWLRGRRCASLRPRGHGACQSKRLCFTSLHPHVAGYIELSVEFVSIQVAEILKDRLLWLRDCRSMEVVNVLPAGNNGTIELLYMQVRTAASLKLRKKITPCF